jgi:hypothetical protein
MAWKRFVGTLLVAGAVGACGSDGTGPIDDDDGNPNPPPPPPTPVTLAVTGQGAVSERYTAEVAVAGEWAYTSTWGLRSAPGNAIKIWNVAGAPVLTDSLIITDARTTGDVQISPDGSLLVVATEYAPGSIVIYDRSNPAQPAELARFTNANTNPGVHTVKLAEVGETLYAFLSVDPGSGIGAQLVIVDLGDPAQPSEVWSQAMGAPYVHDVAVRDGWLFTALWDDGMTIWDIGGGGAGSPANPVPVGTVVPTSGNIHNIAWYHDPGGSQRYVFLGEEGPGSVGGAQSSGDIHVIDISDKSSPVEVAIYSVAGAGTHNFALDEANGYLYAAYYNAGVRVLDIRGDLGGCTAAQRTPSGLCDLRLMGREAAVGLTTGAYVWGVALEGASVYASDMGTGLYRLSTTPLQR